MSKLSDLVSSKLSARGDMLARDLHVAVGAGVISVEAANSIAARYWNKATDQVLFAKVIERLPPSEPQ